MKKKIGVVSLGCPKNLVDSEIMLGILKKEEYEITPDKDDAEIIIVNTCGFIESAKQESINTILEMSQLKKDKCRLLIVTGCLAERYKEQIAKEIPEVDVILGTGNYEDIGASIEKAFNGEKVFLYGKLDEKKYLENERVISTSKGYAYLKIAEGCDNCCTYCIIPSLRGRFRSRNMEDILAEAKKLALGGIKEIILVAQDVTSYGVDIYKEKKLYELLSRLSKIEEIEWIRLLYCYPDEIDQKLIDEIASNDKVVKYLDIPIQHASGRILKAMGRRGNIGEIKDIILSLRKRVPEIVLRTSLIVGFPGETEEDFDILYDFVEKIKFDRLGVFAYSKEEDTPAAKLGGQISKKVKEARLEKIMHLQNELSIKKNNERLGSICKVIVEGVSEDGIFYYGRSYGEAPEIDGSIYFTAGDELLRGSFVNVKILNTDEYDLVGEVIYESSK